MEAERLQGRRGLRKTLGLVGLGHVGAIVARGAAGMGMRVLAYDPYVSEDRMRSMNVDRAESLDEVFEQLGLHLAARAPHPADRGHG